MSNHVAPVSARNEAFNRFILGMSIYRLLKRGLDILGAAVLLLATLPLWIIAVLLLLMLQGRPVLFRQQRAGLRREPFFLLKFRTMTDGAPPHLPDLPVVKHPGDPRVTPLGRVLRRLAVDELPQLLNVLRGEMSLVGPRPLPVEDLERPGWLDEVPYEDRLRRIDWLRRRHAVPPGLTGLWQITAQPAEDFENWIACDLAYVETCSLALDLQILLATPWAVLRGRRRSIRQSSPAQASGDSSSEITG